MSLKAEPAPIFKLAAINLNVTNFETGVKHPLPESFATATLNCQFDDWEKIIDWDDRTPPEKLTHTVGATLPGPSTPAGTYPIFSVHSYGTAGEYSVTARIYVHCVKQTDPGHIRPTWGPEDEKSYKVNVYDRLPLKSLTPSSLTVKRGSSLILTVETYADAPPSNTRVNFSTDKPEVFGKELPAYRDIIAKSKSVSLTLTVSEKAPLGDVKIFAEAGSEMFQKITIVT
jgi:hypothetical protein